VNNTIEIGVFKIISETSVAAGIRRIEALTSSKALDYINDELQTLKEIKYLLNNPKNLSKTIVELNDKISFQEKTIEEFRKEKIGQIKSNIINKIEKYGEVNLLALKVDIDASSIKDLSFQLKAEINNLVLIIGAINNGKSIISTIISENLVSEKGLDARLINKEIFHLINGGGGGQIFYATAGGKNTHQIEDAINTAKEFVKSKL
jgi:alanyl-tRNA synthetase